MVAYRGIAEKTLRAARDHQAKSLLDYPIAHHAWTKAILDEEAELQPEFAPTLQYAAPSRAKSEQIDREIELADAVLCLSSFHAQTMVASGVPTEKTVIANLGVDLELFRPHRRSQEGRKRGTRVIFVGQITQRKGISYLLEGFNRADLEDGELVFVGRPVGPAAALLNHPKVTVIPPLPRNQLPSLYATADLFVMPSLVEGFCMTAMEALACGVPTVVTPNTFGDEVVRDGVEGWNVPIRDPDSIASCIARVAERGFEWAAMSAAARGRAEQFSWSAFGRRFVEIARRLSADAG